MDDIPIAAMISTLKHLTVLDMSYSRLELVGEFSRAMEDITNIRAINIGTSPHMKMCYP